MVFILETEGPRPERLYVEGSLKRAVRRARSLGGRVRVYDFTEEDGPRLRWVVRARRDRKVVFAD